MSEQETALDLACESLHRYLAAALSAPHSASWRLLFDSLNQQVVEAAALLRGEFADSAAPLGFGESPVDMLQVRALFRKPAEARELADEYVRVFGLVNCRECPPYETEYQPNDDTFFRSQQMADIVGFYQAFGLQPSEAERERPDHIALELEFNALLLAIQRMATTLPEGECQENRAVCQAARESFLRDHFTWWVPSFSLALCKKAEYGFYAAVGQALAAFTRIERLRHGIKPPPMPLLATVEPPAECEGCLALTN